MTKNPGSHPCVGNLVRFELLPGHRFETVGVERLIEGIHFGGLIADKAFDSDWIIETLNERGRGSSSPSIHAAQNRSISTPKSINGVT